jgi:hypothetical protein
LHDEYNKKIKESRIKLGLEVETAIENEEPSDSRVPSSKAAKSPKIEERLELPKIVDKYIDETTQTTEDGSDYYSPSKSTVIDDEKAKRTKPDPIVEEKPSTAKVLTKSEVEKNAAKSAMKASSKSKVGEIRPSAISPIFEDQNEEPVEKIEKFMSEDGDQYYSNFKDNAYKPTFKAQPKVEIQVKMEMKPQAPYYIPGGFIPNSILIRILWPDKFVRQQEPQIQEIAWKPKELSEDQLKHVKKPKPKVTF